MRRMVSCYCKYSMWLKHHLVCNEDHYVLVVSIPYEHSIHRRRVRQRGMENLELLLHRIQ